MDFLEILYSRSPFPPEYDGLMVARLDAYTSIWPVNKLTIPRRYEYWGGWSALVHNRAKAADSSICRFLLAFPRTPSLKYFLLFMIWGRVGFCIRNRETSYDGLSEPPIIYKFSHRHLVDTSIKKFSPVYLVESGENIIKYSLSMNVWTLDWWERVECTELSKVI